MHWSHTAAMVLLLLSLPCTVPALDLGGQSRTYSSYRETPDGLKHQPLYEYLDLRADGGDSLSFRAGGWYRYDLAEESFGTRSTGDLQYAYLSVRRAHSNAFVDLGRVAVNEGVASGLVDGVHGRTDLRGNFSIAAFGGSPVETLADTRTGDSVYGGRVQHALPGLYTVGYSYLRERNGSADYREEHGVDLWLRPVSGMEITGLSAYNDLMRGWMQHNYHLVLGPFGRLRLTGEASRVYYGRYFLSSPWSAFQFPNIDPYETITTAGGSADLAVTDTISVIADYKKYSYDVMNDAAAYFGGTFGYRSNAFGAGAGYHRMDGPVDELRYDEYRAYVTGRADRIDLTLDAIRINYDSPVNGTSSSTTGIAALGFSPTPRTRIAVDAEYSRNPDYQRDMRGMLTLVYQFDAAFTGPQKSRTAPPAPARRR